MACSTRWNIRKYPTCNIGPVRRSTYAKRYTISPSLRQEVVFLILASNIFKWFKSMSANPGVDLKLQPNFWCELYHLLKRQFRQAITWKAFRIHVGNASVRLPQLCKVGGIKYPRLQSARSKRRILDRCQHPGSGFPAKWNSRKVV